MNPLVGAALITGAGSLISGLGGASQSVRAQREANEANLRIARETNEAQLAAMRENNEFNRSQAIEMFNLENAYNDPLAQSKRLSAAGINPRNVLGQGGSMAVGQVDTPTAASSGVNYVAPQMAPVPSMLGTAMNNFESLSRTLSNVVQAKKAGAEAHLVEITADEQLKKIGLENESMELANAYQKIVNKYADTRQAEEVAEITRRVNNLIQQAALNAKEADYKEALTKVQEESVKLIREDRNLKEKQKEMLIKDIDAYDVRLSMEKLFNKAAVNNQNAQAYQHREAGNLAHEQATTEHDFREDRKGILMDQRALYHLERVFQDETQVERLYKYLNEVDISDEQKNMLREQIRKCQKENDWYDIEKTVDLFQDVAGVGLSAYNGAMKFTPVRTVTNTTKRGNTTHTESTSSR